MGYSIGTNSGGGDIGYGVPSYCDHPKFCDSNEITIQDKKEPA